MRESKLINLFNWTQDIVDFFTLNVGGGGSGGGSSGPSTSTSYSTNLPEYAQPYYTELMKQTGQQVYSTDAAGNVTGTKGYTPYTGTSQITDPTTGQLVSSAPGQQVANLTPAQIAANQETTTLGTPSQFGQATAGLGAGQGLGYATGLQGLSQALNYNPQQVSTGQFGQSAAQQYMSPYLMQSLAPQLAYQQQLYGQQNAGNMAGSISRGTFGGARSALLQSQNQQNQNMNLANILGQGLNTGYTQAQQQFNADQARQLQAQQSNQQAAGQQAALSGQLGTAGLTAGLQGSTALGQLGATQQTADLARLQAQEAVGAQQQQQQQQQLNTAYQNWQTAQNYPKSQLEYLSNILRGNAGALGSTQVAYTPAPSTASQVAGLGLAGLGLYNVLGKSS
jgi:hypothetical protein